MSIFFRQISTNLVRIGVELNDGELSNSPPQSSSQLSGLWDSVKSVCQPEGAIKPDFKSFSGHFIVAITKKKKKTGTPDGKVNRSCYQYNVTVP